MKVDIDFDPELAERSRYGLWRSRWAAIGAAVAVSFGAGGLLISHADAPATPTSFAAVLPTRVLDTRINLGLSGVFTSPTSRDLTITGSIPTASGTQVVVPPGATAVVMNVTVVTPTASGFLSVRPANASGPPLTSSINFSAGMVIANAVTVQLPTGGGDTGKIEITYDALGVAGPTTHVLVDIVGFYLPDTSAATLVLSSVGFTANNSDVTYSSGCVRGTTESTIRTGIALPVGVTITAINRWVVDSSTGTGTIRLNKATDAYVILATGSTSAPLGLGIQRITVPLPTPELVEVGEYFSIEFTGTDVTANYKVCGVEIEYTIPAGTAGA